MKKFSILFILVILLSINSTVAMKFEEAYSQADKKPMVALIYAKWADGYENYLTQFNQIKNEFSESFNFVELDIASNDAKSFNDKYHIYPKLPYLLMFRDGGKVSRYIPRECASDKSCTISKLKSFIQ